MTNTWVTLVDFRQVEKIGSDSVTHTIVCGQRVDVFEEERYCMWLPMSYRYSKIRHCERE